MGSEISVIKDILLPVIVGLLTLNGIFLGRLVNKIDKVELMPSLKDAIDLLRAQCNTLEEELKKMRRDYEQVAELKARFSIIERIVMDKLGISTRVSDKGNHLQS